MLRRLIVVFPLLVLFASCGDELPDFPVEYQATFIPLWTVSTHPVDYPTDAAFSAFEVYSHKSGSELFTVGLSATEAIKQLAENGNVRQLEEQIDLLRSSDRALDRTFGDMVTYPRNSAVVLGFDEAHTQVSVLAKIIPSPDWFVAVNNVQLFQNGTWVDSVSVNLVAYDAGTDSGNTFYAADQPTTPPNAVQIINTAPLAENGTVAPMARVSFKRVK
ncbi:MAG: spondin domain-containing protein [Chitinophagales bacterium]|nr:spondin domain-containing protein [Chitinophagales bacterium]